MNNLKAERTLTAEELRKMQYDCAIPHPPTQETYWFRKALAGEGPHAYDWSDKPHRLVFDLCRLIEAQAAKSLSTQQPMGEVIEFEGLPKRKLEDLKERGWSVVGYAIQNGEQRYGFITTGGFVGWWLPETYLLHTSESALHPNQESGE